MKVNASTYSITNSRLMGRVTVRGVACVGCRPLSQAGGTIVDARNSGLFRVQFADGTRRWYAEDELLFHSGTVHTI